MRASIKKWSVGSPIQSALDALTALIEAHALSADNVARLTVHMPDDRLTIVDDRDMPDVCLQHCLAVTLLDGTMSFAAAHDVPRMRDADVQDVRRRIGVVPSAELTRARPERQSIVEIVTTDGRALRHHAKAVRGTPDNPMTAAEVEAKAQELFTPVLGAAKAKVLVERVRMLESVADIRELRSLWQT
jgi:2-methylcitrate dehydratase PrpD